MYTTLLASSPILLTYCKFLSVLSLFMTYRIRLLNFHCTGKIELSNWLQGENKGMRININTKKEQKYKYFCHF